MKRLGVAGVIVLAGCSVSGPTPVSVDLARVLQADSSAKPFDVEIPAAPKPRPGRVITLPGMPERTVRDPAAVDPARISLLLKKEQENAQTRLDELLKAFYRTQGKAFELDRLRDQSAEQKRLYAAASDKIRVAFDRAAEVRSPKIVRLSLLSGFPDQNPTSTPPEGPLGAVSQEKFDESKRLREEIAALDAAFDAEAKAILREIEDLAADARAKAIVEIELFKAELDKKAEAEARSQVSAAAASIRLKLASLPPRYLPAVPSKTLSLPNETALRPAPEVPSIGIGQSDADRRELARHELAIWLGLNRYVISNRGPDRTEDFIRWRRDHRPTDTP